MLYLIEILHQTTTRRNVKRSSRCCILSKFYIKPQLCSGTVCGFKVVSYRNSTSNHNYATARATTRPLYLIEILHQTTTFLPASGTYPRCILSKFYIKPQLPMRVSLAVVVVSYRNSTSNHNSRSSPYSGTALYLIEILHQTTTDSVTWSDGTQLYLIEILHQTTTRASY